MHINILWAIKNLLPLLWTVYLVVVKRLERPHDSESDAVCSESSGRVTHGGKVEEEGPDQGRSGQDSQTYLKWVCSRIKAKTFSSSNHLGFIVIVIRWLIL